MNKYQKALGYIVDNFLDDIGVIYGKPNNLETECVMVIQELVDKETPMKPIQLEERKYSCPSCAMAFKLKTLVKNMFVNNQYCDVCGQALDWSEEE